MEMIMFNFKLLGKARVPHIKSTASLSPIKMTPPKEVCLPIDQSIGTPATPIVKVGDEVKVGQIIATASGYISAPIHASVSGKVVKIDSRLKSNGRPVSAIVIESDGLMTPCDDITPCEITDVKSLTEAVSASGIVGLGGAGFPTAVKLAALESGKIHTVIINGYKSLIYQRQELRSGSIVISQCRVEVSSIVHVNSGNCAGILNAAGTTHENGDQCCKTKQQS